MTFHFTRWPVVAAVAITINGGSNVSSDERAGPASRNRDEVRRGAGSNSLVGFLNPPPRSERGTQGGLSNTARRSSLAHRAATGLAACVITLTTAGCALDKIADPDKPSDFQQHMERLDALTLPEPAVLTELAVEPEPTPMPVLATPTPAPVPPRASLPSRVPDIGL